MREFPIRFRREACEAFIKSQRHEGWVCLADGYDDGGLSSATMERPALRQLLVAIQAGRVAVAVVYKVDRLTRSLADFANPPWCVACPRSMLPVRFLQGGDTELDLPAVACFIPVDWSASLSCSISPRTEGRTHHTRR